MTSTSSSTNRRTSQPKNPYSYYHLSIRTQIHKPETPWTAHQITQAIHHPFLLPLPLIIFPGHKLGLYAQAIGSHWLCMRERRLGGTKSGLGTAIRRSFCASRWWKRTLEG